MIIEEVDLQFDRWTLADWMGWRAVVYNQMKELRAELDTVVARVATLEAAIRDSLASPAMMGGEDIERLADALESKEREG